MLYTFPEIIGKHREEKRLWELAYYFALLWQTKGNVTLAARIASIGRPYLYKKLGEHGLSPEAFRGKQRPPIPGALQQPRVAPTPPAQETLTLVTPAGNGAGGNGSIPPFDDAQLVRTLQAAGLQIESIPVGQTVRLLLLLKPAPADKPQPALPVPA